MGFSEMSVVYRDSEQVETEQSWLARLTVADGLLGVVLLLAAALRITDLAVIPLNPTEAEQALSVWQFWQNDATVITTVVSPAHFSLTALLLPLLGTSDVVMRLVPALAGLALVFSPWLLRRWLGTIGALAASLLLALSPTLSLASRTTNGSAIALLAGMGLLISWLHFQEKGQRGWFLALIGSLALGLISAPLFYGAVVTLAIAWVVQAKVGPPIFHEIEEIDTENDQIVLTTRAALWPERSWWRPAVALGGAILLGVGTLFLWHLPGLGAIAALPATWLGQISFSDDIFTWISPVLALGRYEIMLLTVGAIAIGWATWQGRPFPTFLIYWFTTILLLMLIQRGNLDNVLLLTLPGYLLAGRYLNDLFAKSTEWYRWLVAGAVLVAGAAAFVNIARQSRLILGNPDNITQFTYAVVAIAFIIATLVYVGLQDKQLAHQGAVLGLLPLLAMYMWGTSWWLTHQAANDTRERWVVVGTDNDVNDMVATMQEVSLQVANSNRDVAIFSLVDTPVLRWYLRDFPDLEFGETIPSNRNPQVLITYQADAEAAASNYVGTQFDLLRATLGAEETNYQGNITDMIRWWVFHESTMPMRETNITIWLRADYLDTN